MTDNKVPQIIPQDISPAEALKLLKDGNFRFINNLNKDHNLLQMVNKTKDQQWPFATILSCMDSRTSAELIFDMGLGDVFSIRIAGNIISTGILGSLEFATAVAGSRIIVVLGHTSCGAIKGACDNVQMGHLTSVLEKIQPAVHMETTETENRNSSNMDFVDKVARLNVFHSMQQILNRSLVVHDLVKDGKIGIVPAMYDVATGKVTFFEDEKPRL